MKKTLCDKCEQVIQVIDWPFKELNLTTNKIFSDLLQYHTQHLPVLKSQRQVSCESHSKLGGQGGGMTHDTSHITLPVVQSDSILRKKNSSFVDHRSLNLNSSVEKQHIRNNFGLGNLPSKVSGAKLHILSPISQFNDKNYTQNTNSINSHRKYNSKSILKPDMKLNNFK